MLVSPRHLSPNLAKTYIRSAYAKIGVTIRTVLRGVGYGLRIDHPVSKTGE